MRETEMYNEKLPDSLNRKLEIDFLSEKVRFALSSDITHEGCYGTEWMVVTESRLLVFSGDSDHHTLFDRPLKDISSVKFVNLIGSAAIRAEIEDRLYHVIAYSDARNAEFGQAADDINNIIKGQPLRPADRARARKICTKCERPIPQELNKCPRCADKRKAMISVFQFLRPHWKYMVGIFVTMLVGTILSLVPPYMSKIFIDYIFKGRSDGELVFYDYARYLPIVVLAILFSDTIRFLFEGLRNWFAGQAGHRTTHEVRSAVYQKFQELSLSYFDKHQTGALMARVNQDTNELRQLLVDFLPMVLDNALMLIGVGTVLFIMNWQLTLCTLVPIVLAVFFLKKIFSKIHGFWHNFMHKRARLSAFVGDSLSGTRVVKAFGQEAVEVVKFDRRSMDYRDSGIELETRWSKYHPTLHWLINLGSITVWLIGGYLLFSGRVATPGTIFAFQAYLGQFYRPVFMLTRMIQHVTSALTAAERVFDIIDTEPEIKDSPEAQPMPEMKGSIEFDNVSFGYNAFDPVIKEMTIKIEANEMIGLVGRSGAGKSTFINLLCRLYDVNKGRILIDGVDIRDTKYADLRRQIGIVLQETFLFSGSIYDNIIYARPEATVDEVIAASKAANAHDFIIAKPDGYDTDVGERGNRLSGGEKQRVAIARAILRDPRILILDEATSSVDAETEKKIQEAVNMLTRGRTTIAIAHRLSTLRNCHRLIVIEDGRIVESGTHEELLEKKGVFYNLVETQKKTSEIIAIGGIGGRPGGPGGPGGGGGGGGGRPRGGGH
ncbi:MAG TPA: ABC transporter ATP-binding protein [Sedimentisphaerales bacterium]|nr:ABC transporter ATP-binding protein [Sedimentisphaerales bacterium]